MDNLLEDIKEKLPKNCIYKIALIASVFAGTNNYCHHVVIAEKVRTIIYESNCVYGYSYSKISGTKYNNKKNICRTFSDCLFKIRLILNDSLRTYLQKLQYRDNAFFTNERSIKSELYYPMRINKTDQFRGYFIKDDNGYFDKDRWYFRNKENKGKYNSDDIDNFIKYLDNIFNLLVFIKNGPVYQHNKKFLKIESDFTDFKNKCIDLLDSLKNQKDIYTKTKSIKNTTNLR